MILKKAFDKLNQGDEIRTLNPEMNWEMVNMDIDGYINDKKIVLNQPTREKMNSDASYNTFTDKNALAAFLNDLIVIDIDSNKEITLEIDNTQFQHMLPKNTVSAKTPHGYHYYFYNDTGSPIPCRVGLKLNNVKYPIDLLSGPKQLIFLPPTRIESACYRWINSPFTHRIEPISKHMRLLDLFAYTKEFTIPPGIVNACMSKTIPNMLCIVWEFQIIYQLKQTCMSSSVELLHSNKYELLYRTTPNSTYYLFLKHAPLKQQQAHKFVRHVAALIQKHNIDGGIVHLGCASAHTHNNHESIAQFNSCHVHNYAKHGLPTALVRAEQTLVQTSVFTHRPISIISADILHENMLNDDHNMTVNEDMFLIIMISNETRIPCTCLLQVSNKSKKSESKNDAKFTKLIQYYMHNVLNATHNSSTPTQTLKFFGEVPMPENTDLN